MLVQTCGIEFIIASVHTASVMLHAHSGPLCNVNTLYCYYTERRADAGT
jgi:hypothetical protein